MTKSTVIGSLAFFAVCATSASGQQIGPATGALVIVGGGRLDQAIVERFLDLAGGPDTPIVVIPTAGGGDTYDLAWPGLRSFREAGATRLTVLHTTDPDVANSEGPPAARSTRGVVQRRSSVAFGRRLSEHQSARGAVEGLGAGWGHRGVFGGCHDPGGLPGSRRHVLEHHHDG